MNQRSPRVHTWPHCLRIRASEWRKAETIATQEDAVSTDVLSTRVADRIAIITLVSSKRIYFDAEMGDATEVNRG